MIRHPIRNAALALIAATVSFGASCVSSDGGTTDRDSGGYYDPYNNPNNTDRSDRPNRIPRHADLVRDGAGKLRWTADMDGVVYVYDRDKEFVSYTGPVRRGNEVIVQPGDDRVIVNERVVSTDNLERNSVHQLYFAAERPDRDRRDESRPERSADGLPEGVRRLARGSGVIDTTKSPGNGVLYVYDEDDRRVVYRTDVRRGTTVRVVPGDGKVYLDGDVAARPRFARGHMLSLYFGSR